MLTTRSGRNPSQNEFELNSFIKLLAERKVSSYLEIGARHGDTFFEVMKSLPAGSIGMAMDLPGGLWGTEKSRSSLEEAANELRSMGYQIYVHFGDSKKNISITAAMSVGPFDAILIDGDHLYDGAKYDWLNYGPMGHTVAFHDIFGHGQIEKVHKNPVEVPRLWAEIKESEPMTLEYIDDGSLMGIGVVCK